jgi:hypothetical protein
MAWLQTTNSAVVNDKGVIEPSEMALFGVRFSDKPSRAIRVI